MVRVALDAFESMYGPGDECEMLRYQSELLQTAISQRQAELSGLQSEFNVVMQQAVGLNCDWAV